MPSSRPDHLPALAYLVERVAPKTILDLGIGSGFKGAFFREYTDVWDHGIIDRSDAIKLHGVEIFPDYKNPLWDQYDYVHIGDVVTHLGTCKDNSWDMVHCGDVIEHLPRIEGLRLIHEMMRVAWRAAVIVTPVVVRKQGTVFGNEHEHHVSQWAAADFPGWTSHAFGNVAMYVFEVAP